MKKELNKSEKVEIQIYKINYNKRLLENEFRMYRGNLE